MKSLNEFIPTLTQKIDLVITYTPDAVWVQRAIVENGGNLLKALGDSLDKAEVFDRPYHDPETMHQVDLGAGTGKTTQERKP